MPKDSKGYGSDPRSMNVTDGHGSDRKHDFYDPAHKSGRYGSNERAQYRKMREGHMQDARASSGSARSESAAAARRMNQNVVKSYKG